MFGDGPANRERGGVRKTKRFKRCCQPMLPSSCVIQVWCAMNNGRRTNSNGQAGAARCGLEEDVAPAHLAKKSETPGRRITGKGKSPSPSVGSPRALRDPARQTRAREDSRAVRPARLGKKNGARRAGFHARTQSRQIPNDGRDRILPPGASGKRRACDRSRETRSGSGPRLRASRWANRQVAPPQIVEHDTAPAGPGPWRGKGACRVSPDWGAIDQDRFARAGAGAIALRRDIERLNGPEAIPASRQGMISEKSVSRLPIEPSSCIGAAQPSEESSMGRPAEARRSEWVEWPEPNSNALLPRATARHFPKIGSSSLEDPGGNLAAD